MMRTPLTLLPLLALCAAPVLATFASQKRVSEKKVVPFEDCIKNANAAWSQKHYGTATKELRAAIKHSEKKHHELIRASIPHPGAPWELVEPRNKGKEDEQMANMFGIGSALVPLQVKFKNPETKDTLEYSLMMNFPQVNVMAMSFNPAMMDKNSELIEYNADKAVLKTNGNRSELMMVLDDLHMMEVNVRNQEKDFLLGVVNQAAVDKLKAAIAL